MGAVGEAGLAEPACTISYSSLGLIPKTRLLRLAIAISLQVSSSHIAAAGAYPSGRGASTTISYNIIVA